MGAGRWVPLNPLSSALAAPQAHNLRYSDALDPVDGRLLDDGVRPHVGGEALGRGGEQEVREEAVVIESETDRHAGLSRAYV